MTKYTSVEDLNLSANIDGYDIIPSGKYHHCDPKYITEISHLDELDPLTGIADEYIRFCTYTEFINDNDNYDGEDNFDIAMDYWSCSYNHYLYYYGYFHGHVSHNRNMYINQYGYQYGIELDKLDQLDLPDDEYYIYVGVRSNIWQNLLSLMDWRISIHIFIEDMYLTFTFVLHANTFQLAQYNPDWEVGIQQPRESILLYFDY